MADHKQIVRQWMLIRRLCRSHQGSTVEELAEQFGVSTKTIRRDLELLESVGFRLHRRRGAHGKQWWSIEPPPEADLVGFTLDEAIVLYLLQPYLEGLSGSFLGEAAQEAFGKIKAMISTDTTANFLPRLSQLLLTVPLRRPGKTDWEFMDALWHALEHEYVLQMQYQSLSAPRPRSYRVHPYAVVVYRGAWYLVAFSEHHGEKRHFKLDRIHAATCTEEKFRRDPNFNIRAHLADSFGIIQPQGKPQKVVVRFSPWAARYVEETRWHHSQKERRLSDGSLEVTFQLAATEELKRWVLSFGRHAQVVRPKQLCQEIQKELQATLNQYR